MLDSLPIMVNHSQWNKLPQLAPIEVTVIWQIVAVEPYCIGVLDTVDTQSTHEVGKQHFGRTVCKPGNTSPKEMKLGQHTHRSSTPASYTLAIYN